MSSEETIGEALARASRCGGGRRMQRCCGSSSGVGVGSSGDSGQARLCGAMRCDAMQRGARRDEAKAIEREREREQPARGCRSRWWKARGATTPTPTQTGAADGASESKRKQAEASEVNPMATAIMLRTEMARSHDAGEKERRRKDEGSARCRAGGCTRAAL